MKLGLAQLPERLAYPRPLRMSSTLTQFCTELNYIRRSSLSMKVLSTHVDGILRLKFILDEDDKKRIDELNFGMDRGLEVFVDLGAEVDAIHPDLLGVIFSFLLSIHSSGRFSSFLSP